VKALVLMEPHQLTLQDRPDPEPGFGQVRVRVHRGGICGSDMHYFYHGGFGTVRMRAPMVLGHEMAGVVDAVGGGVVGIAPGDHVAVNPGLPCGTCDACRAGSSRLCADMRFMGSAMRNPHVDGGFREYVVVTEAQAVPVSDTIGLDEAAVCEPLAVGLHAVAQAPDLTGKRVLVMGFGTIGATTFLAACHAGAAAVSASDVAARPLALARELGAENVYDASQSGAFAQETKNRGCFDVVFECSGHPAAVATALDVTRPGGTLVQVGVMPDAASLPMIPMNPLVTKEITWRGTFRFDVEFHQAADLISRRALDVRPLISATFPFTQAEAAFHFAQDKQQAIKVMLDFA